MATSTRLGPDLKEFSVCRVLGDCALVKIASFDQLSEAKRHMETISAQNSHSYIVFSEHNGKVLARFSKPNGKSESIYERRRKRKKRVETHVEVSPIRAFRENVAHMKALQEYFLAMKKYYEQSKTCRESRDILAVCIEIIGAASRVRRESDTLCTFHHQCPGKFGIQG